MATLRIISLECVDLEDKPGPDEISIYIDQEWYAGELKFAEDQVVTLHTCYEFHGSAVVDLWEEDPGIGNDDRLGPSGSTNPRSETVPMSTSSDDSTGPSTTRGTK